MSTCRFAQRVARVRNDARLNEEVDPAVIIRQLKTRVATLEEELATLKGDVVRACVVCRVSCVGEARQGDTHAFLTGCCLSVMCWPSTSQKEGAELKDYEIDKLRQRCVDYVNDADPSSHLSMGDFTYTKMKMCFEILKSVANSVGAAAAASVGAGASSAHGTVHKTTLSSRQSSGVGSNNQELENRILELEQLVMQRDNEIAIMVGMIRKENGGAAPASFKGAYVASAKEADNQADAEQKKRQSSSKAPAPAPTPVDTSFVATFRVDAAVLDDPTKAFEAFKTHYPKNDIIRENKVLLKRKYDAAKELAASVNDARNQIKHLTLAIEKLRKQQAITDEGLTDTADAASRSPAAQEAELAAESKLKDQIEACKLSYKKGFHDLSELKKEIQHIQKMLEMSRIKLQKDFDLWYQRQGRGALLTETLVAQPKGVPEKSTSQLAGAFASNVSASPTKSVSPARLAVQSKATPSLSSSASKRELNAGTGSVPSEAKKPATPRSSASVRSSTAR